MKKFTILALVLVGSFSAIFAQKGIESAKYDLSRRYPAELSAKWVNVGEAFEAQFKEGNHIRTVMYDALGWWRGEREGVAERTVPAKVKASIAENFAGANLQSSEYVNEGDGHISYQVKIAQQGSTRIVKIDLEGKVLKNTEVPTN